MDGDLELHVEKFFQGNAAMLNVACLRGRVLAVYGTLRGWEIARGVESTTLHLTGWLRVGLWKNATDSDMGPSIVNSIVHNEEMVRSAGALMKELRYTGFAGLEFMIAKGSAYLMDFNPRINTGSVHPLSQFGLLPLDVLEAMRVGLQDPDDPRLGVHVPTDLDPHHHVFLKFDPRKIATVVKLAHTNTGQLQNSHVSRAPWCDPGIREYLAATVRVVLNDSDCSITAPSGSSQKIIAGAKTVAKANTVSLYDPGCGWCRAPPAH
jgi:hypothetical protein